MLFVVYLLNFVDRQVLSILANDIKADLALTDAELGFLYGTAFAIFYAQFGRPLGRHADSWSRTRLLALGLALWSCMTALLRAKPDSAVMHDHSARPSASSRVRLQLSASRPSGIPNSA